MSGPIDEHHFTEPCPTPGTANPRGLRVRKCLITAALRCLWADGSQPQGSGDVGPGTARRLMPGLGLGSRLPVDTECRLVERQAGEAARLRPIGCQRDILRREEAGK